jgi:hypothetical protein
MIENLGERPALFPSDCLYCPSHSGFALLPQCKITTMGKSKDKLFILIKTLNRGEKRAFKLFAKRYDKENNLYVKLFDLLDKRGTYDSKYIQKKFISSLKIEKQYPVIKNQLFNLVLSSLRKQLRESHETFKVNSQYENGVILLNRGLYLPA